MSALGALAAILVLALTGPAPPARAADPAVKACIATCKDPFRACRSEAAASAAASRAACPAAGDERKACRRQAKGIAKAAQRTCKGFRGACRACCKASGERCAVPPEVPRVTGSFPSPEREVLESTTDFPPAPGAQGFQLLPLPDGLLGFDPFTRTPITAAAECAAAVLACFSPGERNWAGCFVAVPACTSERPFEDDGPACCAAGCVDRFQALLREGRDAPTAFAAAIYESPSCMPGVDAAVAREGTP
jgi:hypothetical protein